MLSPDPEERATAEECLSVPFVAQGEVYGTQVVQDWLENEENADGQWG